MTPATLAGIPYDRSELHENGYKPRRARRIHLPGRQRSWSALVGTTSCRSQSGCRPEAHAFRLPGVVLGSNPAARACCTRRAAVRSEE